VVAGGAAVAAAQAHRGWLRGETQMRQMRRIPRLLRWIPGTAQDVRAYYL
jgi:magnesium chelatase subunit H